MTEPTFRQKWARAIAMAVQECDANNAPEFKPRTGHPIGYLVSGEWHELEGVTVGDVDTLYGDGECAP